jgi:hypothetical protein
MYILVTLKSKYNAYLLKPTWTLLAKEDLNKLRDILSSYSGILTFAKISNPPKFIYRFNTIPVKIPEELC